MPLQTLLSGFGPFGNVVNNPTERLLAHFADHPPPDHDLTICPLPTSFTRAPEIIQATLQRGGRDGKPFDIVLMLGVATGSPQWRVETQGLNWDEARIPDVDGLLLTGGEIVPGGPARLPVTLSPELIERAIEAQGYPVVLSLSAGSYLCNHILYRVLHFYSEGLPPLAPHPVPIGPRAGFLHLPADEHTYGESDSSPNRAEIGAPDSPDLAPGKPILFPFTQHIAVVTTVLTALSQP